MPCSGILPCFCVLLVSTAWLSSAQCACGLDGYVSHSQPLLRITAFIRWPWPSFAGSSLGHGFLFLPAVHVHHSVVRHLVAAWQEEQSALRAPNYQLGSMRHRLEKRGERREAKGVENRGFISRRINNTCRRCIILQWRRHSQINCYPGVVCQQVDQRAARCRGALRRQRVKIVYV